VRDIGSGTGWEGGSSVPARKVSGLVPNPKVALDIVVELVIAESLITNVPVPLIYGEKFPLVMLEFALL
jgi:hypothetical protein